jgi:hypothetical protein
MYNIYNRITETSTQVMYVFKYVTCSLLRILGFGFMQHNILTMLQHSWFPVLDKGVETYS